KPTTAPMPSWAACSALSSAPASNGALWTRTLISTSGDRGEEGHFVAILQRLVEPAQLLIARAHQVALGQYLPDVATRHQMIAQGAQVGEASLPVQLLAIGAKRFAVTGEILQSNHALLSAFRR